MRASNVAWHVLSICSVLGILSGCSAGNSAPSTLSPNVGSSGPLFDIARGVPGLRPNAKAESPHGSVKRLARTGPNVYVGDSGNNAVYEILWAGGFTQILSLGSGFNGPTGVAVDANGDVFVADYGNNAVKEMLAVNGGIPRNPVIKTLSTSIDGPYGLALDSSNNLFVTNDGNGFNGSGYMANSPVYELLAPSYATVQTIGSFYQGPVGLAIDGSNNLYVGTAASTSEIFEMLAPGYSTVNTLGGGYDEFLNPYGLAVDRRGNVMIGDYNPSAVQKMTPNCFSTSCVTTLTNDFYRPTGVAVDRQSNVYGADYASGEVYQIIKSGGYHTINMLGAGFSRPFGVAVH
jgi:streptogramin lyase